MSNWTAASSDCGRDDVHIRTADLYRPNARFTPERQRYQVLTPFGKLGYSQAILTIRTGPMRQKMAGRVERQTKIWRSVSPPAMPRHPEAGGSV